MEPGIRSVEDIQLVFAAPRIGTTAALNLVDQEALTAEVKRSIMITPQRTADLWVGEV